MVLLGGEPFSGPKKKERLTMFRYHLVMLLWVCLAAPGAASSWADSMFDQLAQDFGSVPRGPTLNHSFKISNRSDNAVHIANVRVSCGCVTASALDNEIAPGKDGAILAQMDTRRFTGLKTVTIFVQFDRPQWDEVRLTVTANGRDDISVAPESFAFGRTQRGAAPSAAVVVSLRGHSDWQIVDSKCDSNYVQTGVKEQPTEGGEAAFEVSARLRPDTPVGKWYTDVWLTTSDANVPRIRVPLTVEIEPALSVNPHLAELGEVKVGDEVERKILIRGSKPFRITEVKGTDAQLSVHDNNPDSKPVHILTIKLKPAKPGDLKRAVHVTTDLKDEGEVVFQATARVVK